MSRQTRSDARLAALEADYRERLVEGLRECAAGRWGLLSSAFDDEPALRGRRPPVLAELEVLADRIADLRRTAGHAELYPLHARLLRERAARDPNQSGEPRRAALWLTELGEA